MATRRPTIAPILPLPAFGRDDGLVRGAIVHYPRRAMTFTVAYIAASILIPLVTFAFCMVGEKLGH
jgi:hypothetical protein